MPFTRQTPMSLVRTTRLRQLGMGLIGVRGRLRRVAAALQEGARRPLARPGHQTHFLATVWRKEEQQQHKEAAIMITVESRRPRDPGRTSKEYEATIRRTNNSERNKD
ncbi:uncharacterized protein SPSK_03755 [Sporothrix schenckii 1099-18]|uniref:Uncharacterized protein n=1 Tax=Sporothrix schenckii 1099-18 TaxID=1397361 RepID=A0A0F2M004_SPOSC|nr:uncharacterized protein SPSK_03755 [Sporothrix schenckii 1099-18]KJR82085.1 hypothetical protein SPSK_03755 [Sporothrix schenckii 1099-18]